jgi:RNA polymerase sigma factor (sigma-70 family)
LVGETYPLFRRALDRFRPPVGVDFVGYLGDRLYWGIEHEARRIRGSRVVAETEEWLESGTPGDEERQLLDRILLEQLLDRLKAHEAALVWDHVSGYTSRELAEAAGVSEVSVRKRLERVRRRLRELANAS